MEKAQDINRFLDDSGKVVQLSKNHRMRYLLLEYLAEKFESDCNYTESEVNEICNKWHTFGDYFVLRRELVDNGLLCREQDGSRYWKAKASKDVIVNSLLNRQKRTETINSEFSLIDFNNWDRRQYFFYFTKILPTRYSIGVDIDITNTYNLVKRINKKFFLRICI